eukprot:139966_1
MANLLSRLDGLMDMMETTEEHAFDFSVGNVKTITTNNDTYGGIYKWTINNITEVNKVLYAEIADYYESDAFTLSDTIWRIKLNPNGSQKEHKGSFGIYLRLQSLPKQWKAVFVVITIQCLNPKRNFKLSALLQRDNLGGTQCLMALNEFIQNNIKSLVFVVSINILRVIAKENDKILYNKQLNNCKETAEIDWKLLCTKQLKSYKLNEAIQSQIYDDMWMLELCPTGYVSDNAGFVTFRLTLCHIPPNIEKLLIKWKIYCKQLGIDGLTVLREMDVEDNEILYMPNMKITDFTDLQCVNIKSSICIYDKYTIDKQNYASMDLTLKEWNKYVQEYKHIDRDVRTECIVYGFARYIAQLIRNIIPESIIQLLFLYIDDHFTINKGTYLMQFYGKDLDKQILKVGVDSAIVSNLFEIGGLKWFVRLYPNKKVSQRQKNVFCIYVGLISMPNEWKSIFTCLSLECIEMNCKLIIGAQYKQNDNTIWGTRSFFDTEQVKRLNLMRLRFRVKIKIQRVILVSEEEKILYQCMYGNYKKKTNIKFIIDENKINSMKLSEKTQTMQSDIHDDIWILECWIKHPGDWCRVDLRCIGLPMNVFVLKVKWKLYWKERDMSWTSVNEFKIGELCHYCTSGNAKEPLVFDNWKGYKMLNFSAEIVVLKEY